MNKRVDYIDVIKGFVIFLVIWVHTACPNWLTPLLVNSIFFFLSGIFFKCKPLKIFLFDKVRYILFPFMFFYIVSYFFRILECYWDNRTLTSFDWSIILDVFDISSRTDYLFVNVPLWFLLCLIVIQILYYFISFLDKRLIAVIALLCIVLKNVFLSIPTPFMINAAFYYMGFFAFGNLVGKPWIDKLYDIRFRKVSLGISVLLFVALFVPMGDFEGELYELCYHIKLVMVFFILMSLASWFNGKLSLVRFWGVNSLTILGLHILVLTVLIRITNALYGESSSFTGFIQSVIVMLIMYVVILFCNRYIPFLVGKKHAELVR